MSKKYWYEGTGTEQRELINKISDENLKKSAQKIYESADELFSVLVDLENKEEAAETMSLFTNAIKCLAEADLLCNERASFIEINKVSHQAFGYIVDIENRLRNFKNSPAVCSAHSQLTNVENPIHIFLYACSKFLKN